MRTSQIIGTLLLMLLHLPGITQSTYSANGKESITLSFVDVPFSRIISELSNRYGYAYCSPADVMNKRVTIHVKNVKLREVLNLLSRSLPVRVSYKDNIICVQDITFDEISKSEMLPRVVSGKVTDVTERGILRASVMNHRTMEGAFTDSSGRFELQDVSPLDTLIISHVNFRPVQFPVLDVPVIKISLTKDVNELPTVVVHTGYQDIPVEQATGSFKQTTRKQVTSVPRFNVQEGFESYVSGYLPALKTHPGVGLNVGSLRGRNTIYGNTQALILLDDFPFHGDLYMLNPNDIESITVAKDASSNAIYGARAANGIILITTKKPTVKQPLLVSFNNFLTISNRPNVNYLPSIKSKDYILEEENLFSSGFYKSYERWNMAVSPVIETLIDHRNGYISTEQKDAILNDYRKNDIRSDISDLYYRPAITRYTGVHFSGGSDSFAIYFSLSNGRSVFNERGIEHKRNTMLIKGLYHMKRLSIATGLFYSNNRLLENFVSPPEGPAYLRLADAEGQPLAVPYEYRSGYVDSISRYALLDWKMRPLQELQNANNGKSYNYLSANAKMDLHLAPSWQFQGLYQFGFLQFDQRIIYNLQTYYARNLINSFAQMTPTGIISPIPVAPIADEHITTAHINNWRLQVNYHRKRKISEITVLAGTELRSTVSNISSGRTYGYSPDYSKTFIDHNTFFPQYLNPRLRLQIPTINSHIDSTDYYLSYFGNAFYTWSKKVTMSWSLRWDRSNKFGMNVNQQFIPLWAAGALVHLHKFSFFPNTFPYISLRSTIGKTGNDGLQTPWSTTISQVSNDQINGLPIAYINNPGNSNLQFEEMHTINIGLDLKTRDRRLQFSLDVYRKKGSKLLGYSRANPTTGVDLVKSNTGALSGFGIDANLNTINIKRNFTWETNGWVSYTTNRVRSRELLLDAAWKYVEPSTYVPLKGYPVDAIFALPMAGLNKTGDPLGYLEGKESKNYWGLLTSSDLVYEGPAAPTFFGNLTNTLQYGSLTLSVQISGKFNYYFRRTSLSASNLLQGRNMHSDYYKRWRKPGDEKLTQVPALNFIDQLGELFYKYSDALVERGDHIRLQSLQLMYDGKNITPLCNKNIRLQMGLTLNNIGIIWRANKIGLDPDVVSGMLPVPRSTTLSISIHF